MVLTRYILGLGTALGLFLSVTGSAGAATPEQLADRALGDPKAPVTIYEYASLTCSHCADFAKNSLPKLKAEYVETGKVRIIFRDFPLNQGALYGSIATRCVPAAQYWPLLEHLFRTQETWGFSQDPKPALTQQVKLAGLSEASLSACLADKGLEEGIIAKRLEGEQKYTI
jgi:protein-disulfide isomerase